MDADSGCFYDVVVTNPLGSVTSSTAVLTALIPPVITSQLSNQVIRTGDTAFFTLAADCPRSATDKTVAPRTLLGFMTDLGLSQGTEVESLRLNSTWDNTASVQARQAGESVEHTLDRLSAGFQQRGFIRK